MRADPTSYQVSNTIQGLYGTDQLAEGCYYFWLQVSCNVLQVKVLRIGEMSDGNECMRPKSFVPDGCSMTGVAVFCRHQR